MPHKAKLFLVAIFLIFAQFIFAQSGERYYENAGNFSYCPPLNWNITEYPGLKYHIILGPVVENTAANINFADEVYSGSLNEYVSLSLAQLGRLIDSLKLISREPFKTNSGIVGEYVIVSSFQYGFYFMQFLYFLQTPNNRYFVISATAVESISAIYQPIFDECIKTFELMP
jgi:hypothetical protein